MQPCRLCLWAIMYTEMNMALICRIKLSIVQSLPLTSLRVVKHQFFIIDNNIAIWTIKHAQLYCSFNTSNNTHEIKISLLSDRQHLTGFPGWSCLYVVESDISGTTDLLAHWFGSCPTRITLVAKPGNVSALSPVFCFLLGGSEDIDTLR